MATASRTLVRFSSAAGRPRSANTFPELATRLLLFFAIPPLVILLSQLQPIPNEFRVGLCRFDTLWGLFLEGVQHIDRTLKSHCINRPVCVASKILNDFQHSRSFALPRLGLGVFTAKLRDA